MPYNQSMNLSPLFVKLTEGVAEWRKRGYDCPDFLLIGEILTFQRDAQEGSPFLKFLREPQFLALETYWFVRLIKNTPHIMDLYKGYYPYNADFVAAMGVPLSDDALRYAASVDAIIENEIKNWEQAQKNNLVAAREAAILDYPSYILALAMGAGKTVLIGAIIATEFAMSLRYPKGNFMKNALVFAPGTTIIESLRELSDIPYEKILPPDLNRDFLANLKIEYPGKGKEIQTQQGSSYNLIVTNTEKISLRAKKRQNKQDEAFKHEEVEANLRLQKITSLPNLGVFSDEAHHTYGNTFDKLKRVRETINYIDKQTSIVAVINTTGTPYYKKQILKEVIVWYGLGDGIADNILKDLNNGIHQYDIGKQSDQEVFEDIIREFFQTYGKVSLANGAKAKIAFYFKTQNHLNESRVLIEQAMVKFRQNITQILINTQTSSASEVDEFRRLNNPDNQKRVILLISKGVEGWNCPSLFACALIKEQTTSSNNYVLQAATRCLRQVPENIHSAKIFLDSGNAKILDKELQDNFGTDLNRLKEQMSDKETVIVRILKTKLPKLEITRTIKRAVRTQSSSESVTLKRPKSQAIPAILRNILTPDFSGPREILMPTGDTKTLPAGKKMMTCHAAAWKIASKYHVPMMSILKQLNALYPKGELPNSHLYGLFQQVEKQRADYEIIEENITDMLALIRVKDENNEDVFEKDGTTMVHHLRLLKRTYEKMKNADLLANSETYSDKQNLSFHYTPYNFDSKPEGSFFRTVLHMLDTKPNEVEAFLFTGGLTDPKKTDFHFEYLGEDKRYHHYFPDFVLVKKTGEFYIVEVKSEKDRGDKTVQAKQKAVEKLQKIQSEKFKYQVVYTDTSDVGVADMKPITDWLKN